MQYTELHDLILGSRDDNYGQTFEYTHKEYLNKVSGMRKRF